MKSKFLLVAVILSVLIIKGCKKDPEINKEANTPTPYEIPRTAAYPQFKLPANNPLTEEGVLLGRMLFYDPILSRDSTISCESCHRLNLAFTDGAKVSKGIRGQVLSRNAMPLFNLMWNNKFFWDGRANSLQEQVLVPIQAHNEMDLDLFTLVQTLQNSTRYKKQFEAAFPGKIISPEFVSKALEQFLVSVVSFNAPIDQLKFRTDTLNVISASALRGLQLFLTPVENGGADCFHCHSNIPFFGNNSLAGSMSNNGLDASFTDNGFFAVTGKESDKGKFKIPSLRNIELTAPYMHDGRFDNLEEVIDFYSDGINLNSPNLDINILSHNAQLHLTQQQKDDIVEFLKTLTDNSFVTNPAYKSPF
ncbi:MAG: cytochrome-c peroxidase [Bacteroidia bacterium]|nr:cytochrome-c peroxidase [Bacteroidia bacterium]